MNSNAGLIALTGGILAQLLSMQDKEAIDRLISTFGDRLYVELQRHGLSKELELEDTLIDFAYQHNIPLVATNDVFFSNRLDYEAYDILTCISEGSYAVEGSRKKLTTEHYFKSVAEMEKLFSDIPEAIHNTLVIAQRCSYMPRSRQPILPKFPCRENKTENEELKEQATAGLKLRIAKSSHVIPVRDTGIQEKRMDPSVGYSDDKRSATRVTPTLAFISCLTRRSYSCPTEASFERSLMTTVVTTLNTLTYITNTGK